MVGTNTVTCDNPELTTRKVKGDNPIRITIDRNHILKNKSLKIFNKNSKTIIFNENINSKIENIEYINYINHNFQDYDNDKILNIMMNILYKKGIKSILIEGGAKLLNNFINNDLWDEARIFVSNKKLINGIKAPNLNYKNEDTNILSISTDKLYIKKNYKQIRHE